MNYIYDIAVNFNADLYEFFEWKKSDDIVNVRKIPFFRVSNSQYIELKYNNIKIDKNFILKLTDTSLTYGRNSLKYCFLISNTNESIGIMCNKDGEIIKRSGLLFDEEDEVNDEARNISVTKIEIVDNKKILLHNVARSIKDKKNYLLKYINNLSCDKDYLKLKYLYYDYFDKEIDDINIGKSKLLGELNNDWNNKLNKLYELVKMLKIKNP